MLNDSQQQVLASARFNQVDSHYFGLFGMTVAGRDFTPNDVDSLNTGDH